MKNKSVDVNIQDLDGHTALHWAADKGSSDIVKALLSSSNIRINTQNHEDGYCPLSIAVGGGFKDVVAILVEDERTDLNVSVMHCNVCLLHFVIFSPRIIQYLICNSNMLRGTKCALKNYYKGFFFYL